MWQDHEAAFSEPSLFEMLPVNLHVTLHPISKCSFLVPLKSTLLH